MRPWTAALASLALGACTDELEQPPGKRPPPIMTSDQLYSLEQVPRFHLTLGDEALAALMVSPKEYVHGDFRYQETEIPDVGVRLKGNLTLTPLDQKPPFRIKFNEFREGRRFLGLESLMLHNAFSDASLMREYMAYGIFRAAGLPASRVGYAELFVNDEPYGIYINIEPLDDAFLARNYADPWGNLYEGEHGDDLDGDIWEYEQDEGSDESRMDLQRFADLAILPDDNIFTASDTVLDVPRFTAFTAASALVGHFDGYWISHNYFIYHEPTAEKWTFLPWSVDQSFIRRLDAFGGEGFLTRKCLESKSCLLEYVAAAEDVTGALDELDPQAEIDAIEELIVDSALADDFKHHGNSAMASSQDALRGWLHDRADVIRERVDCLEDGSEPDEDGDGYGICWQDCDDDDDEIKPGAVELCDGVDNDCNGYADDVPECPCPSETLEGTQFFFCDHVRTWTEARQFCTDQGHQLARLDSRAQNDGVWEIAQEIRPGLWSIGLDDLTTESDYRWQDGTAPAFEAWATGEPAQLLAWFDCVFLRGGDDAVWVERNCVEQAPFVCSPL